MNTLLKLAVAAGLLSSFAGCSRPEAAPAPRVRAVYVTEVRNDGGLTERILSATVRPRIETELAFRAGGKVTARLVELGQHVRAGQPLARIDPADSRLAVDAAAAQLRAAEIEAAQSASDAARLKRLLSDGSVPAADQERQQARADAAAARVAQARRNLELSHNRVGYSVLTAPFEGIVTALRFETGQVVAEGQTVATLARPTELEVVVDVPESLAPQLRDHQASARVGDPGTRSDPPLRLRLRELAPGASTPTRTFRARYAFVSPPSGSELRIGTTAELCLMRDGVERSAELPASALLATGQQPSVWVADKKTGALTRQQVRLLSQTIDSVRVIGLADGALVVSVGAHKLDAGLKVQPIRRPPEALARVGSGP